MSGTADADGSDLGCVGRRRWFRGGTDPVDAVPGRDRRPGT
jgi:hypothetical protein